MEHQLLSQAKDAVKKRLSMYFLSVIIVLMGFIVTFQFVEPAPPSIITLSTGHENGAYYRYALLYKKILARDGIEVKIRVSKGSVENLKLLIDKSSGVDLAFIQGGINLGSEKKSNRLQTLGSLYFEPLWVFYRKENTVRQIADLKNKKISIGASGSGTQALALAVLDKNGVNKNSAALLELGPSAAFKGLLSGKIDALFLVASPNAPIVQQLLSSSQISILNFTRANAYSRIFSFLSVIQLPQGALDLGQNLPNKNVQLLASTANLVSHYNLHPALVSLLMQAAKEIHGKHGLFEKTSQFPTGKYISFGLHKEAKRYYQYGPTFLQRYLPFWVANWMDRLKIMLLPFLVLMLPLVKILPPFYRWLVRKRIYKWYAVLREVDPEMQVINRDRISDCLDRLAQIEDELKDISIPLSYTDEFYNMRLHIELVRDKLNHYQNKAESESS